MMKQKTNILADVIDYQLGIKKKIGIPVNKANIKSEKKNSLLTKIEFRKAGVRTVFEVIGVDEENTGVRFKLLLDSPWGTTKVEDIMSEIKENSQVVANFIRKIKKIEMEKEKKITLYGGKSNKMEINYAGVIWKGRIKG